MTNHQIQPNKFLPKKAQQQTQSDDSINRQRQLQSEITEIGKYNFITEDERKINDNQFTRQAENIKNSIYGNNGERYLLPINSAHLIALEYFCKKLFETSELPFKFHCREGGEFVDALKMANDIKLLPAYARIYSPSQAFPPDFDLFFKTYREHEISRFPASIWDADEFDYSRKGIRTDITPEFAKIANDFVRVLREKAKRERLKSRMSDWRSGYRRNKTYLRSFMIELLEENSRIMVVDLVFLYKKAACNNAQEAIERGLEQQEEAERQYQSYMNSTDQDERSDRGMTRKVDLEELKSDLKHFFNNMRKKRSLFSKDKFIDYFGRIEYSKGAGYHVHICFFYKGAQAQRDIFYSHEIGKYWAKITGGRGYYHSCNANAAQGKYKNVGIGMIEHDDFDKIRHLWTAVAYFVKASQVVRVKRTDKEQMVLHGKREKRQGERLGRPRGEGLSGPEYRAKLERIFA
jgi:hypothetical protein